MTIPIFQVDAFAEKPFGGNPAAVCLLDAPRGEAWMQGVAREMNLSETAFLFPEGAAWRLRWFTPTVEVDLCGHATLASAHVLSETGRLREGEAARFLTKSGPLSAARKEDRIEMDFPAVPVERADAPPGLREALGVAPRFVGKNRLDYLVEVDSEAAVRGVRPDFRALAKLPVRGVIVTARSESKDFDFVSRFFAPAAGVNEDPVTGSAHCALGPHWGAKLGKTELAGWQASERGGLVRMRLAGERIALIGKAVTVLRGELTV